MCETETKKIEKSLDTEKSRDEMSHSGFDAKGTCLFYLCFKVALKLSEEEVFVGKLLYTLFEKMQWNTHSVVEDDLDKPRDPLEENSIVQFENSLSSIGNGLFPTYALLNSSCDNNVSK